VNRKIALLLIFSMSAAFPAFAENIKLKSGQEVEGAIIEQTDRYIKIDFMGVPLTYFLEDIESVDGVPPQSFKKELQEISQTTPLNAEECFYRGVANAKKADLDQAISDFSNAIELNPGLAEAYYNRGLAFIKKNNLDFAIEDFNKAVEINPKYKEAFNNRAVAYFKKQEYEKALQDTQKAQKLGYNVNPTFLEQLKKNIEEQKE